MTSPWLIGGAVGAAGLLGYGVWRHWHKPSSVPYPQHHIAKHKKHENARGEYGHHKHKEHGHG
jgi:hypothetical protein